MNKNVVKNAGHDAVLRANLHGRKIGMPVAKFGRQEMHMKEQRE
jgi:hypothetical protein